jgi:hypothetical protein
VDKQEIKNEHWFLRKVKELLFYLNGIIKRSVSIQNQLGCNLYRLPITINLFYNPTFLHKEFGLHLQLCTEQKLKLQI